MPSMARSISVGASSTSRNTRKLSLQLQPKVQSSAAASPAPSLPSMANSISTRTSSVAAAPGHLQLQQHHCSASCSTKISSSAAAFFSHCRIGSNVKIVNSIVMNHVIIEDGCLVQGSVICSNVHIQERVVLKDCQIGAGYVVTAGSEHKAESLAKK